MAPSKLPYSDLVGQWEAASARLDESFLAYMQASLALGRHTPSSKSDAMDLVSRIDHKFESLYASLEKQLPQSRWNLARTRNKLASSCYAIPEEILSQVFKLVIFDKSDCEFIDVEKTVRAFYRRLYSLMGVCSFWSKLGASQAMFWSLVPMINDRVGWFPQQPTEASLQRALGHKLHLMASIKARSDIPEYFIKAIQHHVASFRSINISSDSPSRLNMILAPLLRSTPESLTEFSLCYSPSQPEPDFMPESFNPFFFPNNSLPRGNGFFPEVRILRLSGVRISWEHFSLSQMVELSIGEVYLGFNSIMYRAIQSISMAPQLRKLQIFSIDSHSEPYDTPPVQPISFPCLRLLEIRDLHLDPLGVVLSAVAPGAHQTTVYLTNKSFWKQRTEEIEWVGSDVLIRTIRSTRVHTLMLAGNDIQRNYLPPDVLNQLLRAVPSIECFLLHHWDFRDSEWVSLCQRETLADLPKLRRVEITGSKFTHTGGLEGFIANHPVEEMVLGGDIYIAQYSPPKYDNPNDWEPITKSHVIVESLKAKVPKFEVVDSTHEPAQFNLDGWAL